MQIAGSGNASRAHRGGQSHESWQQYGRCMLPMTSTRVYPRRAAAAATAADRHRMPGQHRQAMSCQLGRPPCIIALHTPEGTQRTQPKGKRPSNQSVQQRGTQITGHGSGGHTDHGPCRRAPSALAPFKVVGAPTRSPHPVLPVLPLCVCSWHHHTCML